MRTSLNQYTLNRIHQTYTKRIELTSSNDKKENQKIYLSFKEKNYKFNKKIFPSPKSQNSRKNSRFSYKLTRMYIQIDNN